MSASGEHTFKRLGSPPQPVATVTDPTGTGRATTVLALVMVGWMLFMMALAAFGGAQAQEAAEPVTIGQGVLFSPASGWASAEDLWAMGSSGVSLQKAGAVAAFAADVYAGSAEDLLDLQLQDLEAGLESFSSLPSTTRILAGGTPAVSILFSGVADGGRLEGELMATQGGGIGVVMLVVAPPGQLRRLQSDIDEMLDSVVIP